MQLSAEMALKLTVLCLIFLNCILDTNSCDEGDRKNFKIADTDRNGYLDFQELCVAQEQEEEECSKDFESYDLNADGRIICQGNDYR